MSAFHFNQGINSFPLGSEFTSRDFSQFTVLVGASSVTPRASLVKPDYLPHIKANLGKTEEFHLPLDVDVNSQLIREISTPNRKYRLCSESAGFPEWRLNSGYSSPCITSMNQFVPVELDVESIVGGSQRPIEETVDMKPSKYVGLTFDGSEESFARLQNDYYRSEVAVGDPIRSKRTKRTLRDEIPYLAGVSDTIVHKSSASHLAT